MKIENIQETFTAPIANISNSQKPANDGYSEHENNPAYSIKSTNIQKLSALAERFIGPDNALVIEKDPAGIGFIYKSINRTTGEIVRIWPKQEIASHLQSMKDVDARGIMLNQTA